MDAAVRAAAAALAVSCELVDRKAWRLSAPDGRRVTVRRVDGWMCWRAQASPLDADRLTAWLSDGRTIVKAVPTDARGSFELRCEWPLGDEVDTLRRVDEIARAFLAAAPSPAAPRDAAVQDAAPASEPRPADAPDVPGAGDPTALQALCAEAGWPTRAEGGQVRVHADVRAERRTAYLREDGRAVLAQLPVAAVAGDVGPRQREVLTSLLSRAAGQVAFARPWLRSEADGSTALGFEVRLGPSPTAIEVQRALEALFTAWDICGPELALMARPESAGLAEALVPALDGPANHPDGKESP